MNNGEKKEEDKKETPVTWEQVKDGWDILCAVIAMIMICTTIFLIGRWTAPASESSQSPVLSDSGVPWVWNESTKEAKIIYKGFSVIDITSKSDLDIKNIDHTKDEAPEIFITNHR